MLNNDSSELHFSLYYISFPMEEEYVLRFYVPENWVSDEINREEMQLYALLTMDGCDFNQADAFISINMLQTQEDPSDIQGTLNHLENVFSEDGWIRDERLSSIKTYDNRQILTLMFKDNEFEYIRKQTFLPLKEDLSVVLLISFQVNHLEDKYAEKFFPIFELLLRSCKFQKKSEDAQFKSDYIKDIIKLRY